MARKIAIVGSKEHLKKSVALLLIRRGMAEWVVPGSVIARHAAKTAVVVDIRFELQAVPSLPYIPEAMPMSEIPGLRFQPPAGTPRRRLFAIPVAEMYASL